MASALSTNEVTVLYNDVLFRSASSSEVSFWASAIDSGSTVAQVTASFVTSSEAQNFVDPVIRMYQGLFDRAPDLAGLGFFVAQEHAGLTAQDLGLSFVSSSEFARDYGAALATSPTAFIDSLYLNVLGRAADPDGLSYWLGVLGTPTAASEATVIVGLVNSAEFIADTQSEINAWLTAAANSAEAGTTPSTLGTPTYSPTLAASVPLYTVTETVVGGGTSATEGSTVLFHLATANVAAGTQLNYTLSGVTAAEVAGGLAALAGTVTVGSDGTVNFPVTLTSTAGQGLSGTLSATISVPAGDSGASVLSASVALTETPAAAPLYTVTEAVVGGGTSATEGSTIVFDLATSNVATGTQLHYTLAGVTAAEIVGGAGALSGIVTVGSNGTANVPVTLTSTAGQGLSGTLSATISVPAGDSGASVLSASVALTETAAAAPPLYTVTEAVVGGGTSATEGSTVLFHLATSNVAAGTQLNYTIAGVTASEVVGGAGALTGTVTVGSDGTVSFPVALTSAAGQHLSGNLSATITVPPGDAIASVLSASVALTETAVTPPQTLTLTTAIDSLAGGPNATFAGTYSDGGVGNGNTFNVGDTLAGSGAGNTLSITPNLAVGAGGAATSLSDNLWTDITGIENLSITTAAGVINLTTGAAFEAAFVAAGVDLTALSTGGAINLNMTTFTGDATLTTTTGPGAQTITTGSGLATVIAASGAGAITVAGADLLSVSATTTGSGAQTITDTGSGPVTVTATDVSGAQTIITGNGVSIVTDVTVSALVDITVGNGNDTINVSGSNAGASEHITLGSGSDTVILTAAHIVADTLAFSAPNGGSATSFTTVTNAVANDTITFADVALNNTVTNESTTVASVAAGIAAASLTSGYTTFHDGTNTYVYENTGNPATSELMALVGVAHSITGLGAVATILH